MTKNKKEKIAKESFVKDPLQIKIPREQLLEIKLSHLERELLKKDIQSLSFRIEALDRDKIIFNLKISDLKAQELKKQREHKEIIDSIGRKLGVDLKNSVINPETGEVTFT